jgi:hypothetical protein
VEPLEILGESRVELTLAADVPVAMLAVRINDVAPDGAVTRVSYGLLNLTHRQGHENPRPLTSGRQESVVVTLNDAAHRFAVGHRLRLALSTSYWPVAWPAPAPATLTFHLGTGAVILPIRPPRPEDDEHRPFPRPESAPGPDSEDLQPEGVQRTVEQDTASGELVAVTSYDLAADGEPACTRLPGLGLELGHSIIETFAVRPGDPLSARGEILQQVRKRRGTWQVAIDSRVALCADERAFHLEAEITARLGGERIFFRSWRRDIPRDGV